ncbi:hypothetical protein [Streptomyces sp. VRA16 Mangrove soil]|nr:hypothetical protein [Streptomyces sp. VRA16 Mangrove soil]
MILRQLDAIPSYELLPRSSFADHLARWLLDAMREFGTGEGHEGPAVA